MPLFEVRHLEPSELYAAAGVAARALRDSPTTLAAHGGDPFERMARTHGNFRALFETLANPQLGAVCGNCPIGVAVATPPGHCVGAFFGNFASRTLSMPVPPEGDPRREEIFWASWAESDLPEEHWHLGPVGVEPGFQGRGVGGAIMHRVCEDLDRRSGIGWLETDKASNVRFYSALGFEVVDEATILDVPTWYMRRDPLA